MAKYKCKHCGRVMTYRKKKGQELKKWIPSICGSSGDKDVHLILQEKER